MKQFMLVIALQIVMFLSGCGQSVQEKEAQERLKVMEQQKELVKGFQDAAVKARADAAAAMAKEKNGR
ncbi:MAG TPA: hypothetical protein VJ654_13015 [Noviherbaspirillum sp.]|nr:hypothetical protein [Noviherbaspirillum sp.]